MKIRIAGRPATLLLTALALALMLTIAVAPAAHAQVWTQVTVQRGDTLAKIAARNCTTWNEIWELNRAVIGPNPNYVRAGTVLTVPNRCGGPPGGNQSGIWDRGARNHATGVFNAPWYTVARGDTLTSIALRFGTTVATIRTQNNFTGNLIYPGQRLFIGGGGVQPPIQPTPVPPPIQPTPVPPPPPGNAERVTFEPYAISATRTGIISGDQPARFVLRANAGQQMSLFTISYGAPLNLEVTGPTGQRVSLSGNNGLMANAVSGWLPTAGDYTVTVWPVPDGTPRFSFNFNITFVIQ